MVDVLLIQTPPWGTEVAPLGIAYLASYLKEKGSSVKVLDVNIVLYNQVSDKALWNFEKKDEWSDVSSFNIIREILNRDIDYCVEKALYFEPLIIGLSVNQNSVLFSLEFARRLKNAGHRFIIAGGWACYNKHERDALSQGSLIDAFVIGEGEETLHEIVHSLKDRNNIKNIKGVFVKEANSGSFSPRLAIKDLDLIPHPGYEEFELTDYKSRILCMLATRGCIGKCAFCNDRIYQGTLRCRSPHRIVQEIEHHVENNNIRNFSFNDLLINGDLRHLESLCDLVIQKGLDIGWIAQAVARRAMTYELLVKMKKAGCHTLQFGIESGSDRVLQSMRKMFTVTDAERALSDARRAGIKNWINIIVGFPGEKEEDLEKTIEFIRHNKENIDKVSSINTCNVVYNSTLMRNKQDYGVLLSDKPELLEVSWHSSDGNCDELRKKRSGKIMSVLRELEIPVGQTNLFAIPS